MFVGLCAAFAGVSATATHKISKPNVWARGHVMIMIGEQTRILEAMAVGTAVFDARAARTAAGEISEFARQLPELYEAGVSQEKTAANTLIYERFEAFRAQSIRLAEIAESACAEINSVEDLRAAFEDIEKTCETCHASFRK